MHAHLGYTGSVLLGRGCGGSTAVPVTSAEQTSLEAAETALNELNAAGARLVGAVLNRAPLTREAFYYSRYYRPEYDVYLSPTESAADAPADRPAREEVGARTS